jgi:transposase
MMTKNADKKREQMLMFCMDDMVPQNHMLRAIDKAIDWTFIYDLVEDKYCMDNGRPSMDPVMLIKIPFIQYLYGIKSMRQTIKEIEVNVAYRWFLGLDMLDPVPHFSTFGKNYTRRFKDTDLFEQIFSKILEDCMKFHLVDTEQIFVDATHVKACANSKKMRKRVAHEQALWYEDELKKEISKDRENHGKKPLKDKNDNQPPASNGSNGNDNTSEKDEIPEDTKTQKCSTSDPESGWFHKGEHKHVFAYAVETACDKHGWILGYTVHPGNEHDSRTFKALYDKIKKYTPDMIIADAGYRTPAIAHELIEDGIDPLFPYKCPMTKDGFFRKYEYVYDEHYDCYICPENHILNYSTTNRDGYKEYKSCGQYCASCPSLKKCTESKDHVKVVTRHVWEEYMEKAEDIRHTLGNKQIYDLRKETIERIFGTAKEQHGFRYTQYVGKDRMEMKTGLTFACMNLKKLAKMIAKSGRNHSHHLEINRILLQFIKFKYEMEKWCQSFGSGTNFVYSLKAGNPVDFLPCRIRSQMHLCLISEPYLKSATFSASTVETPVSTTSPSRSSPRSRATTASIASSPITFGF